MLWFSYITQRFQMSSLNCIFKNIITTYISLLIYIFYIILFEACCRLWEPFFYPINHIITLNASKVFWWDVTKAKLALSVAKNATFSILEAMKRKWHIISWARIGPNSFGYVEIYLTGLNPVENARRIYRGKLIFNQARCNNIVVLSSA